MKIIITIIVFFILMYFGFLIDSAIVSWFVSKVPSIEWRGFAEIIAWIFMIIFTGGAILTISLAISAFIFAALNE